MELLQLLQNYKHDLISTMTNTSEQKAFVEKSFSRWYMNASRDAHDIFPLRDISDQDIVRTDIVFAKNQNIHINIDVVKMKKIHRKHLNTYKKFAKKYFKLKQSSSVNNITTPQQQRRLKKLYNHCSDQPQNYQFYRDTLLALYSFIGINNVHLSMPPIFKGMELFGSPLNTHNREYCSPLKIEKMFCSRGSFFEYEFHRSGLYLCNPPFDENIILRMAYRLNIMFSKTHYSVTVVVTVPVWDSKTQRQIGARDYGLPFEGFEVMVHSRWFQSRDVLLKNEYPYYDYYTRRLIPASNTHLVVLSNTDEFSLEDFKQRWKKFKLNK